MSIINDALKKVQDNLNRKGKQKPPRKPQPQVPKKNEGPPEPKISALPKFEPTILNDENQQPIQTDTKPQPEQPVSYPQTPPPLSAATGPSRTSSFKMKLPALITLLVVICSVALSFLIISFKKSHYAAPTAKPGKSNYASDGKIKIKGIMMMSGKNVALINNDVYETGDSINDMKIVEISKDRVKFLKDGKYKTINIKF